MRFCYKHGTPRGCFFQAAMGRNMVTCQTCGLLTHDDPATKKATEAGPRARQEGILPNSYEFYCYGCSVAFPKRPGKRHDEQHAAEQVLRVRQIQTPIECPKWCQYLRGKTPQEHEDMANAELAKLELMRTQQEQRQLRDDERRLREEERRHTSSSRRVPRRWVRQAYPQF